MKWSVIYEKAIRDNGDLFFPQKITREFLENAKRTLGSYRYSNQYLNELIPLDKQTFKREWFKYYAEIPLNSHNFIFVDPAISQADTADFTGVVCVAVDSDNRWYVRDARRYKITPTQIIDLMFKINDVFKPKIIGIEAVAYQKSLLYFLDEEMRRRRVLLPVKGILPPTDKNKQLRILSLVPRFEWGHLFLNQGLVDLEMELLTFPRGAHDDLIDALASIEYIYYPPDKEKRWDKVPTPNNPDYEKWYIDNLRNREPGE